MQISSQTTKSKHFEKTLKFNIEELKYEKKDKNILLRSQVTSMKDKETRKKETRIS